MELVGTGIESCRCDREETSIDIDDLTVLVGENGAGKPAVLDALVILLDEQAMCCAADLVLAADGKRNVPPERDVEPAMLSLAELFGSIQQG